MRKIFLLLLLIPVLGFGQGRWFQSPVAVNITSFGAATGNSDNRAAIIAARDYIYSNPVARLTLSIPKGVYQVSDSIKFDKTINILGEGTIGESVSELVFPAGKKGLIFSYQSGENGFGAEMRDIKITGQFTSGYTKPTIHAITIRTRVKFENVIVSQFDGDGFHVSACAIPTNGDNNNYGNASLSTLRNVTAINCNNGIFAEGCDANTILIENPNTSENRRWGIYLNGQLGSIIVKPHTAFNGAGGLAGQNSVVAYNGKYYAAIPGHDGYFGDQNDSNVNKQPDISSYYWKQVPFMFGTGEWDASKRYYSGGAIAIPNQNSWSNIVNTYTEAFQPPINLNGRSKVDGGTNGAGVRGGSYDMVIDGERKIMNSNLVLPNINETVFDSTQKHLTIGKQTTDYSASLVVYNNQSLSGNVNFAGFETTAPSGYLQLKNPYSTGYIGYSIDEFNFYPSGYGSLAFTVSKDGVIIHGIKNFQTNTEAKNAGLKPGTIYMTAGFLKAVE